MRLLFWKKLETAKVKAKIECRGLFEGCRCPKCEEIDRKMWGIAEKAVVVLSDKLCREQELP